MSIFNWQEVPNNVTNIPFRAQAGLDPNTAHSLGNDITQLDVFLLFCGDELFEMIAQETNDYAAQQINSATRKSLKSDAKWTPVTKNELKTYLALYIIMSQVKKPDVKLNWSTRKIIETPIYSNAMPRDRFLDISRFLHFSDNTIETNINDKLNKIRPVIRYLETKFLKIYQPEENISLDESLMKMRSRLSYIQFNPKKGRGLA